MHQMGVHIGATWQIRLNDWLSRSVTEDGDRRRALYPKLLWPSTFIVRMCQNSLQFVDPFYRYKQKCKECGRYSM